MQRDRLALRGADCVLVALGRRFAGARAGHNASLVVHARGVLKRSRVERALSGFLDHCPWPAARLGRPFPWGPLSWMAPGRGRMPLTVEADATSAPELSRRIEDELNRPIDPRREPPLRMRVLDLGSSGGDAQSVLIMTWSHFLMDPRGAELLLECLAGFDREGGPPWGSERPEFEAQPDPRPVQERGRIALKGIAYLRELGQTPPLSLGGRVDGSTRARYLRRTYGEPDGGSLDRRSREISWRLALVGRAVAGLWRDRGLPDVPFLLPLSVDQRRKGAHGPFFGNNLAFHYARFRPSEAGDPEGVAKKLRQQMIDALREGQIDSSVCGMDFLSYRPVRSMLREMTWASTGETFSFNCADTLDFAPGLEEAFGARVVDAYHVPTVFPRPGLGVFFSRFSGRNSLVVAWVEGVVKEAEVASILDSVAGGLGWVRES